MGALGKMTGLVFYRSSCGAMDNASDYESEACRFESFQDRKWRGQMEQGVAQWKSVYLWNITVKVSGARDDGGDGHVEDKPLSHDHHLHHHHKEQGQQLVHLQIYENEKLK